MRRKWIAASAMIVATLAGTKAHGQVQYGDAEAVIANAPHEERAEAMEALFVQNANGFVYVLQGELAARGFSGSSRNGLFDRSTISALGRYCAEAGISEICARAPLSEAGVSAIAEALFAPGSDAVAEMEPQSEPTIESEDVPEALTIENTEPEMMEAGPVQAATTTGPVKVEGDPVAGVPTDISSARGVWSLSGAEIDEDGGVIGTVSLLRSGVYDPDAASWIVGPGNYDPDDAGRSDMAFTAPTTGSVRLYPLRGRDNQSWVYTVVEGLQPGVDYRASWSVTEDGDRYEITDFALFAL